MMALITSRAGSVLASLLCVALLFCLSGCGSSSSLLPVEGKVTVDGQALTRGSIAFHPDAKKQNTLKKALGGEIKDGTYTIYTDGKPGAPPGWYNVTVAAATEADTSKVDTIKSLEALPKPPETLGKEARSGVLAEPLSPPDVHRPE